MIKNERQGFTLIEILIVVAIIAILASVVLVGLGPTQQSGRDARRLSDLHEIQNALELFYNKCGFYPGSVDASGKCVTTLPAGAAYPSGAASSQYGGVAVNLAAGTSGLGLSTLPNDPTTNKSYLYRVSAASSPSQYMLEAQLENLNNSVFTSYSVPADFTGTPAGDAYDCNDPATAGNGWYCLTL
jgi:prepilin-type N-terminal cleavage/methylation domain-containing protein